MITLEKVREEICDTLERGGMNSVCLKDLVMLYYLEEKMEQHHVHKENGRRMDLETAKNWVRGMKNSDGSSGGHWTYEQTYQMMKQRNIDCDPVEFYAVMNMLWSDYGKVAEKHNVSNLEYWSEMAKAFLMDKDAGEGKTMAYYECVAGK